MNTIPPRIAARIRIALRASLDLNEYLVTQGYADAARDRTELVAALVWVARHTRRARAKTGVRRVGPVVHEGQRWPAYGARGRRRSIVRAVAWSGYNRE
jgi:hypothetical protein